MWYMHLPYICNRILQPLKKNKIMSFPATWIGLEIIILNKVSQRKTNIIRYYLCVESSKNDPNKCIYKTEIDSQT